MRLARASAAIVVPTSTANRRFKVLYAGETIGSLMVTYSPATGKTRITTEIDLAIKALFFTMFAYSHLSEEIWRDGRLMSLNSKTVEDGETIEVGGVIGITAHKIGDEKIAIGNL